VGEPSADPVLSVPSGGWTASPPKGSDGRTPAAADVGFGAAVEAGGVAVVELLEGLLEALDLAFEVGVQVAESPVVDERKADSEACIEVGAIGGFFAWGVPASYPFGRRSCP
jgi:hypothetical protein